MAKKRRERGEFDVVLADIDVAVLYVYPEGVFSLGIMTLDEQFMGRDLLIEVRQHAQSVASGPRLIEIDVCSSPLCPADPDGSGQVGVPDIFTFLSDWFSDRINGDVDADGATMVVHEFLFLSWWFAGCD